MPTRPLPRIALFSIGLTALVASTPALAKAPIAKVDARVDTQVGVVVGTIEIVHAGSVHVRDPLKLLPDPPSDLHAQRTWPGLPEKGSMHIVKVADSKWSFTTVLPRRFGDLGALPGRGVFANGGWYPQPITSDGDTEFVWTVKVQLPPGAVGAVGDQAGRDSISWAGVGDRVSLSALPSGHLSLVQREGVKITLVTRRPPRRALRRRLPRILDEARPKDQPMVGVLVQAPLRRRLARAGLQQAYVSDRAWRVSPGIHSTHDVAVVEAIFQSWLQVPTAYERELAGSALAGHYAANRNSSAAGTLKWFSWNPVVHAILNDRRLPFWGDIFRSAVPQDPVKDTVSDLFSEHTPSRWVIAQASDKWGENAAWTLGTSLASGAELEQAAEEAEINPEWVEGLRRPVPMQDYRLQVDRGDHTVSVRRHTIDARAPSEHVVVRINGKDELWTTGEGPATFSRTLSDGPRAVQVDPRQHTKQESRMADNWPGKPSMTVSAWVNQVNSTAGWVDAYALVTARGTNDTRNLMFAGAQIDDGSLPQIYLSWLHKRGPLQDGLNRPHRFQVWIEPSWTNPRFFGESQFTLGGGARYAVDTRVGDIFPLRGGRVSLSAQAGVVPATTEGWTSATVSAGGIASPHPRVVFAGRASASIATGEAESRLLWIGGSTAIQSLPPRSAVGRARLVGEGEARVLPLRNASIPLGLAWLSALQLNMGTEAAWLRDMEGDPVGAIGITGGTGVIVDLFGVRPSFFAVRGGVPVFVSGANLEDSPLKSGWNAPNWKHRQLTLRFDQAF